MKNILILPGNSSKNATWLLKLTKAARSSFDVTPVSYLHWENGDQYIDLDAEILRLKPIIDQRNFSCVIAKSVGSVLALKLIAEGFLNPDSCIFAGLPINLLKNTDLPVDEWIGKCHMPICILQNNNDPMGTYQDVLTMVKRSEDNISCVELDGNTHDYNVSLTLKYLRAMTNPQ